MDSATTLLDHPAPPVTERGCLKQRVTLADGAAAELVGTAPMESLRFFAPGGKLLFEYDARSGKARVTVEEGDLEVASGPGDLVLRGGRRVRLEGESVEIAGRAGIYLTTESPAGPEGSVVSLRGDKMAMTGADLTVTARTGDLRLGETRFTGEKVRGWVDDVRLNLGKVETLAGTLIRKARDVYDVVEGLTQLQTGRLRTLVKGTWHSRSGDTFLTAERDVNIDGEKIHLG